VTAVEGGGGVARRVGGSRTGGRARRAV